MTQRNLQCLWNSFGTINARKRHSLLHSPLLTLAHRQLVVTQNDGLPCGLGMGSAVVQVAYAVQQSDGTLSGWTVNQDHPLPCPVAAQAIAYDAVSNSIVLMGGDATGMGGDSTVVYQGTLDSNFDVTGWSFLPSLQGVTGPISRNAGATWNGYVYTLGGLVGLNDDTNAVYYLKGSVRSKRVGGPAKSCITPGSIRFRFKIIVECQLGGWTSTDQVLGTLVEETSDHLRCVDLQPS